MPIHIIADERHAALVATLAGTTTRPARIAALYLADQFPAPDLLDDLDRAVAEPCWITGEVDQDRIVMALGDAGIIRAGFVPALIEDLAGDRTTTTRRQEFAQ